MKNFSEKKQHSSKLIEKLYRLKNATYKERKKYLEEWENIYPLEYVNVMPKESIFGFVLQTSPIDYWLETLSPRLLHNRYSSIDVDDYQNVAELIKKEEKIIKKTIHAITGEKPIKIAFTSIPIAQEPFELVGLAKILSNGTSFIFSYDLPYLEFLIKVEGVTL